MFNNIGGKLKTIAKVECWMGIILSVILGIMIIAGGVSIGSSRSSYGYGYGSEINGGTLFFYGLLTIVAGSLISWIGALAIYALGDLVENSDYVRKYSQKQIDVLEEIIKQLNPKQVSAPIVAPVKQERKEGKHMATTPVLEKQNSKEKQDEYLVGESESIVVTLIEKSLRFSTPGGTAGYLRQEYGKQKKETQEILSPIIDLPDEKLRSAAEALLNKLS